MVVSIVPFIRKMGIIFDTLNSNSDKSLKYWRRKFVQVVKATKRKACLGVEAQGGG